jgi:hypothetical protein
MAEMKPLKLLVPLLFVVALAAVTAARAGDGSSIVPISLVQRDFGGGRIYVPVRIATVMGKMRLDTGASTSRVTVAPWNRDLPVLGQSESTGAFGAVTRCDDVEARNIELPAEQGNNIGRAKYALTRCPAGDGDDLLGLDFFKGARFTLDFDRRQMIFFAAPPPEGRRTVFQTLGPNGRLLGIPVRIGAAASLALFDTGAEISAVDRHFVETHRRLFTPVKGKQRASEASGGALSSRLYKIRSLDLGEGHVVHDVHALAYDFGALREALGPRTSVVLGFDVLNRFNWELDLTQPARPSWVAWPRKP